MGLEDEFRLLVSGYYGITYLDEYDLKVYVLKDIENYIRDFIGINPIDNYNYLEEAVRIERETPLKTKLQDSLLVLHKIKAPMEIVLLVNRRIRMLEDNIH